MAETAMKKEEQVETPAAAEEKPVSVEISETDLLKGLKGLEAKVKGEEPAPEEKPEPTVEKIETPELAKTVEKEGSEVLAKSLEVSTSLREFADLVGDHVDSLSKSYASTLDNQNAAILAISGLLEGLTKAVDGLTEQVSKYGEKPAAPASSKTPTAEAGDVLKKGTGTGSGDPEQAPEVTKGQLSDALLSLVKSADKAGDRDEADRFTDALVKFDSTGHISDRDLNAAIGENKRISGQG